MFIILIILIVCPSFLIFVAPTLSTFSLVCLQLFIFQEMLKSSERHETPRIPSSLASSSRLNTNGITTGGVNKSAMRSNSTVIGGNKSLSQPAINHARLPSLQLDPPPEFCGGIANSRATTLSSAGSRESGDTPRRWGLADISPMINANATNNNNLPGLEPSTSNFSRSRLENKNNLLAREESRHVSPRPRPNPVRYKLN